MSAQTVAELQAESCPRISGADLLDLLDSVKFPRPKVLVIDIRGPELYPYYCYTHKLLFLPEVTIVDIYLMFVFCATP